MAASGAPIPFFFDTATHGRVPIRLLVLDCDGVIFNSNALKTQAYRRAVLGLGARCKPTLVEDAFPTLKALCSGAQLWDT